MAMQGNLKDMAVADLIQHNCQDRKIAKLVVCHHGEEAEIYFRDGNVYHASLGETQGEEAVYQILAWEEGTFSLETGGKSAQTSITRSWSGLLLDGARRLDEESGLATEPINTQSEAKNMAQLDDLLKQMGGEVNGFIAAAVVGMDGLSIAQLARGKVNPEAISAQMTLLFKLVDTSVIKLKAGNLEDNLVTTDSAYILMRYMPEKQYFVGIAADRKSGNLGNLRLMSKMYTDRLAKAMPR
ncbi:MAG: DUF4388 domain-containing protein [Anaerolineales bacterium]|nr:DUF4388 domain-containing protein [Anaerolineales bacterium]